MLQTVGLESLDHICDQKSSDLSLSNPARFTLKPLSLRVLRSIRGNGRGSLGLACPLRGAGNEPEERLRVLDAVDELVRAGMLEAGSGDFYALTVKGKEAVAQS